MEKLFEKHQINKIENFIYFGDLERDRKLNVLNELKQCGSPAKESLASDLERMYKISHEVPELLKFIEATNCEIESGCDTQPLEERRTHELPPNDHFEEKVDEIDQDTIVETIENDTEEYLSCDNDDENYDDQGGEASLEVFEGGFDHEGYRQDIPGQNILKNPETRKFKCIYCEFVTSHFKTCEYHLKNTHKVKHVVPCEQCPICLSTSLAVWSYSHKDCRKPKKKVKNRHYRSGRGRKVFNYKN